MLVILALGPLGAVACSNAAEDSASSNSAVSVTPPTPEQSFCSSFADRLNKEPVSLTFYPIREAKAPIVDPYWPDNPAPEEGVKDLQEASTLFADGEKFILGGFAYGCLQGSYKDPVQYFEGKPPSTGCSFQPLVTTEGTPTARGSQPSCDCNNASLEQEEPAYVCKPVRKAF